MEMENAPFLVSRSPLNGGVTGNAQANATGWPAGHSAGPAAARVTLDLWRSLHTIVPPLAAAASVAANEASATGYFAGEAPHGAELSEHAGEFARIAITACTAVGKQLADRYVANRCAGRPPRMQCVAAVPPPALRAITPAPPC